MSWSSEVQYAMSGGGAILQWGMLHRDHPSIIQKNIPGNRLYSLDGKAFELAPKLPGMVFGEQLARIGRAVYRVFEAILPGRVKLASPESCYQTILIQYPQMDDDSTQAVQKLCADDAEKVEIQNVQMNAAGVQAVAAALEQNTALKTLSFSGAYCDTAVFANAFTTALERNHRLQNLTLDLADINPSPIIPSPMTERAAKTFFQKLPCFNLSSLDMGFVDLTSSTAESLMSTFQQDPYFPLKKFSISWHENRAPLEPKIGLIWQAMNASRCVSELEPGRQKGLSPELLVSLLQATKSGQTLSNVDLWCASPYALNSTQREALLAAIEANPCFVSHANTAAGVACFEPDVAAAIQNITQGRTPCARDAQCLAPPRNCSASRSDPPPSDEPTSPSSTTHFTESGPFFVVLGVAASAAVTAVLAIGKKRGWWCHREEVEPGAAPANDVPQVSIPIGQTPDIPATTLPSDEGAQGEI